MSVPVAHGRTAKGLATDEPIPSSEDARSGDASSENAGGADMPETDVEQADTESAEVTSAEVKSADTDGTDADAVHAGTRRRLRLRRPSMPAVLPRVARAGTRRLAGLGTRSTRIVTGLVIGMMILAAVALGFTLQQHRTDTAHQQGAADALAAANTIVPDLLTYQADGIEADFGAKYPLLAGAFANDFRKLSQQTIIPTAQQRKIVTEAKVVAAGVTEHSESSATVLMFINQSTTSADDPEPTLDGSRVRISLVKEGDVWKVSGLQPI